MIIDGRKIAERIVSELIVTMQYSPHKSICFVHFTEHAPSKKFVALKSALAEKIGIEVAVVTKDVHTTEEALACIESVTAKEYDAIVVQLPLPEGVDTQVVLDSIPFEKDIDMLGTEAKKHFERGETKRVPPVAAAIWEVLTEHSVALSGKEIVVLGKGRLVGEPVQTLLTRQGVKHISLDSTTPATERIQALGAADIIISGIGVPHSIQPDMVQEGVILIDAGTSEQSGKLVGDIDPACADKAGLFTPVPGGVGPITVACLFQNLFRE